MTRCDALRSRTADHRVVSSAYLPVAADPRPVPDRMTLWPVDDGRFGLDATFQGASGYQRAQLHGAALGDPGVTYTLKQELDGGWPLRLGPFPAPQARNALDSFLSLDD